MVAAEVTRMGDDGLRVLGVARAAFNSAGGLPDAQHDFVFGVASFNSSTTTTSLALSRSLNALRNERSRVFLETFLLKSRGRGPKTTPPPTHNGD